MNAPVPAPSILDASGVDPARAQEILADALTGADDGELFVERSESESFLFDDGRLKSAAYDATEGFGLRVVAQEPIEVPPNAENSRYLETKRTRLGHRLHHQGEKFAGEDGE